ncbi:CyP450 monooxygenase [Daedaleopsis nitida]|nr:CyP450 monooxygenase [Daedaleopsis nitida]
MTTSSNIHSAVARQDNATTSFIDRLPYLDQLPSLTGIDESQPSTWVLLGLSALVLGLFLKDRGSRRINPKGLPLPPGPKRLPLIGSALSIPTTNMATQFRDMGKEYGDTDIVHLDAFGQPMLVICKYDAAVELLDRRAVNYSSRPRLMMAELTSWDWNLGLIPYGLDWRRRRKQFHQFFHPNAITPRQPLQQYQTAKFIERLMRKPDTLFTQIRLTFAATILRISYGVNVEDEDDVYVKANEDALAVFNEALVPGRFLVETLPWLSRVPSWLPGAGFKRLSAGWQKLVVLMRDMPFEHTLKAMKEGTAEPSIARDMLEGIFSNPDADVETELLIARDVASLAYAAGGDTTISTIQTFFLAMVCNPDVQKKARAELDAVVGSRRMPTFQDRDQLPYIYAIAKESLRWQAVTPLGISHMSIDDDEYNGYFIPAGSTVIANQWAMSRQESVYPDAERFNPERFMKDGKFNTQIRDPDTFAFGFGRRICPGRHFAQASMFIIIASVLHTLTIDCATDEHGQPIVPEVKMTDGVLSYPTAYRCNIKPRSPQHEALIHAAVKEGDDAS